MSAVIQSVLAFQHPDRSIRQNPFDPAERRVAADKSTLRIGLINNMPDAALLRTERQFFALIEAATDGLPVSVTPYSLPVVARSDVASQHIAASYEPIEQLWRDPPDAIVVTGTEPRESNLKDEPYWGSLTGLFDWAEQQRLPAMFSCLAAHAAVLHTDGIPRMGLGQKCFGVFDHEVDQAHPLMLDAGPRMWLPHTRWNQVTEASLVDAGYDILSRSADVGVGFFAKQRGGLWLFCQGHPEYDGANLLREYRRDVLRFLRGERPTYPELPQSYFAEAETDALQSFRQRALSRIDESIMDDFPSDLGRGPTWDAWQPDAIRIFSNWVNYVAAGKPNVRPRVAALQAGL